MRAGSLNNVGVCPAPIPIYWNPTLCIQADQWVGESPPSAFPIQAFLRGRGGGGAPVSAGGQGLQETPPESAMFVLKGRQKWDAEPRQSDLSQVAREDSWSGLVP